MIHSEIRDLVRRRANSRCEYCLLKQEHSDLSHHVEHITAKQHGGLDEPANLALACHRCNLRKGPNLTGIDPLTGEVVPLFHPRSDAWGDHFRIDGVRIEGITATGRTTVQVLAINDARRLELRTELLVQGNFP
ncbi:MAG TPA: HNH endonuclease [Bryobacteraceae bacterium]|nr:HNH endonuclease [Bryobacteraceae bacterium]